MLGEVGLRSTHPELTRYDSYVCRGGRYLWASPQLFTRSSPVSDSGTESRD